jgi:cell division protein FtsZ
VTVIAAGFDADPSPQVTAPERGRRGSHVESLDEVAAVPAGRAAATSDATGLGFPGFNASLEKETDSKNPATGQFGEVLNPPVEAQLSDPAFDGDDDDDLDIPEFLK